MPAVRSNIGATCAKARIEAGLSRRGLGKRRRTARIAKVAADMVAVPMMNGETVPLPVITRINGWDSPSQAPPTGLPAASWNSR